MRRIIYIILIFIPLMILQGCSENTDPVLSQDIIVVQAYLYANEPVQDIRLTRTLPLDVEEGVQPEAINDADVRLIKNEQVYSLEHFSGDSGYYHYTGDDLNVNAGELFRLEIEHDGTLVYAETMVPDAPDEVQLSSNSAIIPDREEIFQGGIDMNDLIITVSWINDDKSLYYVTVENIEENPVSIDNSDDGFMRKGGLQRKMVFRPMRNNEFRISPMQFEYYGKHLVKVYHVNQEYADLFDSQEQDSRSLNEPLTNIHNGLGVFSAFHSNTDSLILTVK